MKLRFELEFGLVCSIFKVVLGGVFLEGSKTTTGNNIRLNCSFGETPIGTTVEFLVDGATAFNIRLYNGICYRTAVGNQCQQDECQCSSDGRSYFWIYHYNLSRFRVTCKAKLEANCFASSTILFSADVDDARKLGPADNCPTASHSSCRTTANIHVIIIGLLIWIVYCMNRCCPLSRFTWICVVLSVILQSQMGECDNGVSMSWMSENGTLSVYCDVKNLHFGVEFNDPKGRSYHCTAAIATVAPGYCNENMQGFPAFTLKQNINTNRTTLTVKNDQPTCENGMWNCTHGTNTGEYANTFVSVSDTRSITSTKNELQIGRKKTLQSFSHLGVLLLTFITTRCLLFFISRNWPDCVNKIGGENVLDQFRWNLMVTVRAVVLIICVVYVVPFGLYIDIYKDNNDLYFILTAFVGCLLSFLEFIISLKLKKKTDLPYGDAMLGNMDIINPE